MKGSSRPPASLAAACLCLGFVAGAGCSSGGPRTDSADPLHDTAAPEPATAPGESPERHYRMARAAFAGNDLATANREAMLALQQNPLDPGSHYLLGCVLQRKGEKDQAMVGFQRTLVLDPANGDALYNLGTMLLARGEAFQASRLLESAVLTRPDHVPSYINLGKAYFLVGLPELAIAAYQEALRRDASNAIALKNIVLLTEGGGLRDEAAPYRRRLEALRLGPSARPRLDMAAQLVQAPSPPSGPPVAAEPPAAAPAPVSPAPAGKPGDDPEADDLKELLRDLPNVTVERRGGRLTLTGWTSGPKERAMLDRILGKPAGVQGQNPPGGAARPSDVLDLTGDDTGDPNRMVEIDAVVFTFSELESRNVGFNFLRAVNLNFNYFAAENKRPGTGYSAPPDVTGAVNGLSQQGWIFGASVDYVVNIANAADQRIAVLARPHLTALSGSPAKFLVGGELVYSVSGINSGDIKPYPFGTSIQVTPTLLRTPAEDGTPQVHLTIETGRTSVLSLLELEQTTNRPTAFEKVSVTSEAVLGIGQTLILSGLSQRESRSGVSGVPVLRNVPLIKYLFSTRTNVQTNASVIILLTPRDAAFFDERNRKALEEFVEMRRAFLRAKRGKEENMRRFRERYPEWDHLAPNRFASHFILAENSEIYRTVSGIELSTEDVQLNLLGPELNKNHIP